MNVTTIKMIKGIYKTSKDIKYSNVLNVLTAPITSVADSEQVSSYSSCSDGNGKHAENQKTAIDGS